MPSKPLVEDFMDKSTIEVLDLSGRMEGILTSHLFFDILRLQCYKSSLTALQTEFNVLSGQGT